MLYLSSNNDLNQIETRQSKPTEEKEPWYVSRARRITDYYNW